MGSLDLSNEELLKFAVENGILDLALVENIIEMQKKEEYLKKHPYKIYEGKDGKWYTYLPDEKKGRVFKKRNTRDEIENIVIEYWRDQEINPTLNEIFKEWIIKKTEREEISKSTRDRYTRQYEQCFEQFGKRKIKSISEYDIEDFILNTIHERVLTVKGYSNLRTLIFGIFKLAKKKRFINYSITEVVKDIEISRKAFRRSVKTDSEQVFMEDELPKVLEYLEENSDIVNLGLLLLFKSGMRVGELAALKKCDISGNVIHVQRTEVCYNDDNGKRVFEVRDFPKTEAGIREVVIPDKSVWILQKIHSMNPFGEYLFERNGKRIKASTYRTRLWTVCKKTGVVRKSPHKIRKTYGSILIDNGVNESVIISQMGHTDIKTTKEFYYKNRKTIEQKQAYINEVIGL